MATKKCCQSYQTLFRQLYKTRRCFVSKSKFSSTCSVKVAEDSQTKTTHFGFQTVKEEEKEEKVFRVFHDVAEEYDLMNDVMSAGIHRLWKDHFVRRLSPRPGVRHIDVAGGTGDITFRILQYLRNEVKRTAPSADFDVEMPREVEGSLYVDEGTTPHQPPASSHVTVCDINQAMLNVGKRRAEKSKFTENEISWVKGNAECLPMPENTFDSYTIAYGIRNVTHIDKVLEEAFRVLKPGGRFMCLEFSQVPNPLLRRLYDEYSFQMIPVMGKLVAGDWDSYQYLVESIRKFPNQDEFSSMIRRAGFKAVTYENLMFGISAIHSGFKIS